jgi:hypothetical protein
MSGRLEETGRDFGTPKPVGEKQYGQAPQDDDACDRVPPIQELLERKRLAELDTRE